MIQRALHFPDLGECFTYSKRMRTTNKTFFIEGKVTFEWNFEIQVSEMLPSFRIFYQFVRVFGETLTSEVRRKFFMRRTHTF